MVELILIALHYHRSGVYASSPDSIRMIKVSKAGESERCFHISKQVKLITWLSSIYIDRSVAQCGYLWKLNGTEPSLMLSAPSVLFLLWQRQNVCCGKGVLTHTDRPGEKFLSVSQTKLYHLCGQTTSKQDLQKCCTVGWMHVQQFITLLNIEV